MVCPSCSQVSLTPDVCSVCGTVIPNEQRPALTGDPFPADNQSTATRTKTGLRITGTLILWILTAAIAFVRTSRWSGGIYNPEIAGYFAGGLLTPGLLALLVVWLINRNRKNKWPADVRYLAIAGLAFFLSLLSLSGSTKDSAVTSEFVNDKMRHLVRQANGKETTVNANWYDEPAREFYRDVQAFSQEYVQAAHAVDQVPMKSLYTPESYATRQSMRNTTASLTALLDVDKKYESLDEPVRRLEDRVKAAATSSREKENFLNGVHSSFDKTMGPRKETFRREEQWLQDSLDLYAFMLGRFSEYRVRNKKIVFRSTVLVAEFNRLQSAAINARKATLEAKQSFDAAREQGLSRIGLTKDDLTPPQDATTK